jgi:hypothetical protein
MKTLLIASLILLAGFVPEAAGFGHADYDSLLQQYVQNGRVDYQGLKADHLRLANYLRRISDVDPEEFGKWPPDEQKAFWINSYNAITIEGIIRHYPIQYGGLIARARFAKNSIRQIDDFWKKVFIPVMSKDLSLDDIEHQILRPTFDDPRIHFVLVCAAIGCPRLSSRAYRPEALNEQLDRAAHDFISNPEKVRLDQKNNKLYLSSILDWYHGDFKPSAGRAAAGAAEYDSKYQGVVEFVAAYMSERDRNYIREHQPEIEFMDYDWTLNDKLD